MAKKFPRPRDVTDKDPVAWRSSKDIVDMANDDNGWSAKNLSKSVQSWVKNQAALVGWGAVYFPLAYPSKTLRAGAVFVKKTAASKVWVIGRKTKKG